MGRPCDCFCGGSSGGGGGGGGGGDGAPPLGSGNGPWKLYLGTTVQGYLPSSVIIGNSEVFPLQDEFIYGFDSEPSVYAFSQDLFYVHDGSDGFVVARHGVGAHSCKVYNVNSVIASGGGGSSTFQGAGSTHLQFHGGRIIAVRDGVTYINDGWSNSSLNCLAAVDGRSFWQSGHNDFYSAGSNFLGIIGRNGVSSGHYGIRSSDWVPQLIDNTVSSPADSYTRTKLRLGPLYGAIESEKPNPTDDTPNTFVSVFGRSFPIGKVHSNYDPEISSAPIGISPPEPIEFEACRYDQWESDAFFGSSLEVGEELEFGGSLASNDWFSNYPWNGNVDGFKIKLVHNQPPEAFPFESDGTKLISFECLHGKAGTCCDNPCDFDYALSQGFHPPQTGLTYTDNLRYLTSSSGQLFAPGYVNGVGGGLNSYAEYPNGIFTHPYNSFIGHKYYPIEHLKGGKSHVWVGGSLQYYGGVEGHPEGSGSFALALYDALCQHPSSTIHSSGDYNPYWSGDMTALVIMSAFLPSGLEFWKVPLRASAYEGTGRIRPIYCVYYSGDPITNFSGWWHRS